MPTAQTPAEARFWQRQRERCEALGRGKKHWRGEKKNLAGLTTREVQQCSNAFPNNLNLLTHLLGSHQPSHRPTRLQGTMASTKWPSVLPSNQMLFRYGMVR